MAPFRGAIFDVDGVLVDSPHEKAWRESLRELMESDWSDIRGRTTWSPDAFTALVYQEHMSGKPRMSGARAALDYFGVPDSEALVDQYAQRKQEMVVRLGAVTGVGHARLINERFGRGWGWFSVCDLFVLNFLTIVTEFIGISLAASYAGISPYVAVPTAAVALVGFALFEVMRRRFLRVWGLEQELIEADLKRLEKP